MPRNKTKVLIVDDEEPYTALLKENLEAAGNYEILTENVSTNACDAAIRFRPDIILLDVVMPDADGGDVASAFKQHPCLKETPVIFVTALGSSHGHLVNTTSGEEVLGKPFHLETLCRCIDERVLQAATS